jgi:chromatin segregation and condensation protein Rec8/ScpA/Scc1 (kleisin family)
VNAESAIADALHAVQEAFDEARRGRVEVIRELGRAEVGADETAARDALVEALLRREVADGDTAAEPADRLARVVGEARRARAARDRLAASSEVAALMDRWDATWSTALDRSDRIAHVLRPQVAPELADAFAGYAAALRAAHEREDVERAVLELEEAQRRLEAAIAPA